MPDIVLKDRDGNPVTHEGVNAMKVLLADGTEQIMTPGEAEEKTVALDFSEGDMEVLPEDGKLFTAVDILKPETLVPANIAEGVDIAGIIGTLKGGGSAKVASGSTLGSQLGKVVTHGLGIVPDFVVVFSTFASNNYGLFFFGQSEAFAAVSGIDYKQCGWKTYSAKLATIYVSSEAMDTATSGVVYDVNEQTFKFGSSGIMSLYAYVHYWIAVGGLT